MAGLFETLLPAGLTAAAGVKFAGDIADKGQEIQDQLGGYDPSTGQFTGMAGGVNDAMQFNPYSVKTGLGESTVGADGSVDVGVGHHNLGHQGFQNAAQQMRVASLQDNSAREQEIYGRMMAAQQPGLDRARAGMEARSFAQGRGGIQGSQYGGSGEQFAQSRAEAEARNSAMLGAMGQSQQEMMNQGQLANQYAGTAGNLYGQGFQGIQNQLQAMQMGAQNANMAQTGQISGANMAAQLALGGAQTGINALKSSSELYGNMFGALAGAGGPASQVGGMFDDWLGNVFGWGE